MTGEAGQPLSPMPYSKGVGGGGYGPVVTVGGVISGVPVKSMLAVTAISEGTVSAFAIIV